MSKTTLEKSDPRNKKAVRKLVELELIQIDPQTQARVRYEYPRIDELTALLLDKVPFNDDIDLYFDGKLYWLADGFHRVAAYRKAATKQVYALVRQGDKRDALLHAAGANAAHGSPRKPEDVRRAIRLLLDDKEYGQWSNVRLARLARCTDKTVAAVRDELGQNGDIRTTIRNGKEMTVKITGIRESRDAKPSIDSLISDIIHKVRSAAENDLPTLHKALLSLAKNVETRQVKLGSNGQTITH
jgi:hypothetical protein